MGAHVPAIVGRAQLAESSGFQGVSLGDHLAAPGGGDDSLEAMSIAGWILSRTSTLIVGHVVLCAAFRHPALLAKQATTIDLASGGRFELGLGWGSVPAELETFGMGPVEPRLRVERLAESLEIMRALWTGERIDFDGTHFRLRGARQRPTPTRPISITIGGIGASTLPLVREHADWWNVPVPLTDAVRALRARAGRARLSVQRAVAFASNAREADEIVVRVSARSGPDKARQLLVGSEVDVAEMLWREHRRGVDRFYLSPVDSGQDGVFEMLKSTIRLVGSAA
jgi:alkanesulfonate monooxygenase SsuD/methylene tetrahydromethanopterin reductase-like flavin-dependent oxidoreductase (luciferase family)